jgi:hypothetical protein
MSPEGTGENGHGAAVVGEDGLIHLVYQERGGDGLPWRILHATTEPAAVRAALSTSPTSSRGESEDLTGLALPA